MRAVVYDGYGSPATVREVPPPDCPIDGAVVIVRATGVCRSDWHGWRGHDPVPLPHIPGHEFAGVIAEIGSAVGGFRVGDRVTASHAVITVRAMDGRRIETLAVDLHSVGDRREKARVAE